MSADSEKQHETKPYICEDGIYFPVYKYIYEDKPAIYELSMPKEIFQEAFKEYIIKEGLLDVPCKEQNNK